MRNQAAPIKLNPFNPDHLDRLEWVANLTTLGLLVIGVLTTASIPVRFLFSKEMALIVVIVSSAVIPSYLYSSMNNLHVYLKSEKRKTLMSLSNKLESIADEMNTYTLSLSIWAAYL